MVENEEKRLEVNGIVAVQVLVHQHVPFVEEAPLQDSVL